MFRSPEHSDPYTMIDARYGHIDPPKPVIISNPKRFECHVTMEPVFDEDYLTVSVIAECYGFKIADLLLKKRATDTPTRSQFDTFLTGHSVSDESYNGLLQRARKMREVLVAQGFSVWRIKVEEILFDLKFERGAK